MNFEVASPILVVDDHPLYREALKYVLRKITTEPVMFATSGEEALRILRSAQSLHMVLLDMSLPGMSGLETLRKMRGLRADLPLVVVSASDDRREVDAALQAGALAFISKAAPPNELRGALAGVLEGKLPSRQRVMASPALSGIRTHETASPSPLALTPRQRDTLRLLAQGHSNKEIALRLGITEITVKMHVSALFRILEVANRTQAVLAARHVADAMATSVSLASRPGQGSCFALRLTLAVR